MLGNGYHRHAYNVVTRRPRYIKWLLILGKSWKNAGNCQQKFTQGIIPWKPVPSKADRICLSDLGISFRTDIECSPNGLNTGQGTSQIAFNTSALNPNNDAVNFASPMAPGCSSPFPANDEATSTDEWAFLDCLVDWTDEFYALDANFR
jgi:hypothetical protein